MIKPFLKILTVTLSSTGKAISAVWTFPSVLISAIVIAWGAESAQFLISQGFVLAIISWLQTAPEFVVEGVIAWRQDITLMTANFTGATRLLIGFGMPTVYLTALIFNLKKKHHSRTIFTIKLESHQAVPVMGILLPTIYGFWIFFKKNLHVGDAVVLILIYLFYLYILQKIPPQETETLEEMEPVPRFILRQKKATRNLIILVFFLAGGLGIFLVAEPFVESMMALATVLGVSEYFFIQWVAPFLSEFPEFVSASYWARTVKKSPMALMNTVSSVIAELTLLVALIPIVYSFSRGEPSIIPFDWLHRSEILLTVTQALLAFVLLANMEFRWYEALGLFILWLAQLVFPQIREEILFVYWGWILLEIFLALTGKRKFVVFPEFKTLLKAHWKKKA